MSRARDTVKPSSHPNFSQMKKCQRQGAVAHRQLSVSHALSHIFSLDWPLIEYILEALSQKRPDSVSCSGIDGQKQMVYIIELQVSVAHPDAIRS